MVAELDPALDEVSFGSIEAVFDFISKKMPPEKLIIVIDELPYWAEKDEALLSILQKYIDTEWNDKNLMIILCGSALSFMENKVLSEKSPLFGRRNSQIKLEAFNYRDSACFVPNYSVEDKALCYGITGGVAKYLSMIDGDKSLDDNIKRLYFHTDGYLYDETRNILTQEFSDITLVNNIIEQTASGENTVNIIAAKVGEKEPTVLYSLEKLIGVGLVEKKKCITEEKNKKKTQYVLKDNMFKFWYEFIPKAHSVIELEQGIQGRFDCFLTQVGTWWGVEMIENQNGEKMQQSADIDVVAISEVDKSVVIGECKFKNEKIDKGIYETLCRRASLISGKYRVKKYVFFSLSGYTEWFDTLEKNDVVLLSLSDMYE